MTATPEQGTAKLFELDRYVIRRKVLKVFGGSFHVYSGDELVGFSQQKAFKLKEDIRVFADETKRDEILSIRARQIVDFAAAYDILDPRARVKLGAARRKGMSSILRDSWEILDADDRPIGKLLEDSTGKALTRRFLSNLVPQSFHLSVRDSNAPVMFKQHFNPFVYKLEVAIPRRCSLDRRLIFAAAVLICAIEGRQG
jgi:hypothetical protein